MSQSCFYHVIFVSLHYHFDQLVMKSYHRFDTLAVCHHVALLLGYFYPSLCYAYILYYSLVVCWYRLREGSAASVHPAVAGSAVRQQRASLLSQLTRYGDIEEPEQIDDIAYVTPDMLDGMSVLILSTRTSVVLCYLVAIDRWQKEKLWAALNAQLQPTAPITDKE